jgi:uncharacterized protein YceK
MKKILLFLTIILFLFSSCESIQNHIEGIKKERKKRILTVMKQLEKKYDKPVKDKAQILDEISKQFGKIEMSK